MIGTRGIGGERMWLLKTEPTAYGYDEVGNVLTVTDPRLKVTSYDYDSYNRVTGVLESVASAMTGVGLAREASGCAGSCGLPIST